jgi:hypothetical protein
MKGGIIMPITDIPTALQNISECAMNPNMNVISLDISEASAQMISAVRDKMKEFPDFREISGFYETQHLIFERK